MSLAGAFGEIDGALASAEVFVDTLLLEHDRLFGREGENAGLARAVEAMSHCFDWDRLVRQVPPPLQVQEFGTLSKLLLPYLRYSAWPHADEFPAVTHGWPNTATLQVQYVLLCRRMRQASFRSVRALRR